MSFSKDDVSKALTFTGVVVESMTHTPEKGFNGAAPDELWKITWFNRNTGKFQPLFGENIKVVDPESNGFAASGMRKRLQSWWDISVDYRDAQEWEGLEADVKVTIKDYDQGTSVRVNPVKKVGRVGPQELARLKAQLVTEREKAQQNKGGGGGDAATKATQAAADLSDEDVTTLVSIYVGRTNEEAQVAAAKAKLSTTLLNAVATGAAAQELIGRGVLDIDADTDKYVGTGDTEAF